MTAGKLVKKKKLSLIFIFQNEHLKLKLNRITSVLYLSNDDFSNDVFEKEKFLVNFLKRENRVFSESSTIKCTV